MGHYHQSALGLSYGGLSVSDQSLGNQPSLIPNLASKMYSLEGEFSTNSSPSLPRLGKESSFSGIREVCRIRGNDNLLGWDATDQLCYNSFFLNLPKPFRKVGEPSSPLCAFPDNISVLYYQQLQSSKFEELIRRGNKGALFLEEQFTKFVQEDYLARHRIYK